MASFWVLGDYLSFFALPKWKLDEVVKYCVWRNVRTFAPHPLKPLTRTVGRCLILMVKECIKAVPFMALRDARQSFTASPGSHFMLYYNIKEDLLKAHNLLFGETRRDININDVIVVHKPAEYDRWLCWGL